MSAGAADRLVSPRRLLGIVVALLALAGALMVSVTHERRARLRVGAGAGAPPAVTDARWPTMLEAFTGVHLTPGNAVTLLLDGDGTYPLLWRDLRSARRTISVQMYYALPGAVADTLAQVLSDRVRAGVRVLLVLDAFGASRLRGAWLDGLRARGVETGVLRPLEWPTMHSAVLRAHPRIVVVDGRVGYTGGFGLADYWLGGGRKPGEWRESNVRVEGPAVIGMQAAFAAAWAEATGELLAGEPFFPAGTFVAAPGAQRVGLFLATATTGSTPGERFLALVVASARRRLWITNSYFVPGPDFRRLLADAVARGVDVRILTAGPATDVRTTRWAGRHDYPELLADGVRIWEYAPTMMHAKTLVVDGEVGVVGSMNFDSRSLAYNDESSLVVLDGGFAALLERTFEDDLTRSIEITQAAFARRPWWERVLEQGATLLSRAL